MSLGGRMNRAGARHIGEPVVAQKGAGKGERRACLYGAAMVAKHMPGFAAMAEEFEALLRPPATIVLVRRDDPEGAALTWEIPALLLPAPGGATPARQGELGEAAA